MELEWKTCTVGMLESSSESVAESPFDLDLQMPDYMPDIHRILHCAVCPQIQSVSASADRVNAEGSGLVRVLYSSEDGRTHVYEQSFPIRRTAPENIQGSAVRVNATTEYVNCRAAGQRRIHANGSVSLRFSSNKRQEMHIPTASDAEGLQTQTMPFSALSMTSCAEKIFAMSEVVELESDPPIAGVLHSSTFVRMDTSKAVQDKLLVKGEAVTQIWYCSAEDGKTLVRFSHTMPVNQVVEAAGVSETDIQDVKLYVLSAAVTPRSDGSGDNRLLEITLQVGASIRCFCQTETDVVCDAYSTTADLTPKYSEPEMLTSCERWQENIRVQEKTDTAGMDIRALSFVCADRIQVNCGMQDGTMLARCSFTLGMLGENSDGAPIWAEKEISFSCRHPIGGDDAAYSCAPTVCLTSCSASLSQDGGLEVQAEGFVDGMVYAAKSVRMLTSASCAPISADRDPAALTIYFADAGERIWDIARRYRTTVEAVTAENGLGEDTLSEKQMLVIPLA